MEKADFDDLLDYYFNDECNGWMKECHALYIISCIVRDGDEVNEDFVKVAVARCDDVIKMLKQIKIELKK